MARWPGLGIAAGRDVLDLWAGTGKLTRQLAALGATVVAVEPDDEMRVEFERALPAAYGAPWNGRGDPLPDSSVDAITCAQAFHWFDADWALPEMWRVLRHGGGVGLIWNLRDETDPFQEGSELRSSASSDSAWNLEAFFAEAVGTSGDVRRCNSDVVSPRTAAAAGAAPGPSRLHERGCHAGRGRSSRRSSKT